MIENMAMAIALFGQGMAGIFAVLGVIMIIVFGMQAFSRSED